MAYVQNQTNQVTDETTAEKIDRLARETEAAIQAGGRVYETGRSWWDKLWGTGKQPAPAVVPAAAAAVPAAAPAPNYLRYLPVLGIAYFLLRK